MPTVFQGLTYSLRQYPNFSYYYHGKLCSAHFINESRLSDNPNDAKSGVKNSYFQLYIQQLLYQAKPMLLWFPNSRRIPSHPPLTGKELPPHDPVMHNSSGYRLDAQQEGADVLCPFLSAIVGINCGALFYLIKANLTVEITYALHFPAEHIV